MLAKKTLWKTDWHWVIFLCLQVTKRVGGHSSVQAFQQTAGICSDETSARVSSQARYVCANLPLCVPVSRLSSRGIIPKQCSLLLADIPVFPTITATVTFQEFRYDEFDESIFFIPDEYKEDPSRFPDLWPVNSSEANRKWPASLCRV